MRRVTIIAVDDQSEAHLLRLQLEHLGLEVCLQRPGNPSGFFAAFNFFGQAADAIVIAAHGDDDGLVFPEMADGVDVLVLPGNRITPELIAEKLYGTAGLIVSTACSSGTGAFAEAFRSSGGSAYVAPVADPDGRDIPLWVLGFFHAMVAEGLLLDDAVQRANAGVGSDSAFQLFG